MNQFLFYLQPFTHVNNTSHEWLTIKIQCQLSLEWYLCEIPWSLRDRQIHRWNTIYRRLQGIMCRESVLTCSFTFESFWMTLIIPQTCLIHPDTLASCACDSLPSVVNSPTWILYLHFLKAVHAPISPSLQCRISPACRRPGNCAVIRKTSLYSYSLETVFRVWINVRNKGLILKLHTFVFRPRI